MRLLVVEDDPKLAGRLRQGLKEEGFAVDSAPTGAEGLDLALATEYDAIVLDLMLPGLTASRSSTCFAKGETGFRC